MHIFPKIFSIIIGIMIPIGLVYANEVTLQHKGITLNTNIELTVGSKNFDRVVLITHGGLAHREMESVVYLQEWFKERYNNTSVINHSLAAIPISAPSQRTRKIVIFGTGRG